jgi:hypothetical protein
MPQIRFRAKIETIYNPDMTIAYQRVKVPELERRHCDMAAFRQDSKFGGWANSDMFPGILRRIKADKTGDYVRLDRVPKDVDIDTGGFLAHITIHA